MPKANLAQTNPESSERISHGQSDSVSSVFWFPVYEGIFEHAPILQDAVWLFMWLIARTTREENGSGRVLGGIPIDDGRLTGEIGVSVKVIRRWRRILLEGGYILAVRTPYGFKYTLLKSKKYQYRDRPKLPISQKEIGQIGQRDRQFRAQRSAGSGSSNKTIQGQHKEEAEEAAPASPVGEKPKPERYLEAWEAVGIKPCGFLKFVQTWENIYGDSLTDEELSVTMERAIQHCQENGIKVPPPFFQAKRAIEKGEMPNLVPDVAGPRGVRPELMR